MSEKFAVGQWVTVKVRDEPGVIKWIDGLCGMVEFPICKHASAMLLSSLTPFLWQVGKTYRTTLDGVTATIEERTRFRVVANTSNGSRLSFDPATGELSPMRNKDGWPTHLLPYLSDEPPPVAEAATFSEFAEADECDEPTALQSLLTEFSHRREQCQRMAESWETKAAEWRKAEQMIVEAIERAKR